MPVHWNTTTIWNRHKPDGLAGHQETIEGVTNYAYVRIKNRGSSIANNTVVRGYHSKPSAGVMWPTGWQSMATSQIFVGTLQPNNAEEKIAGPFSWVPNKNVWGHDCILMVVSADGDPSNADNFTVNNPIEDWRLVPNDNNVAQRNVALVAGAGGIAGLVASLQGKGFWIRNTLQNEALTIVTVKMPEVMEKLGWQITLQNFPDEGVVMQPLEQREVIFDVIAGKAFTADDIKQSDTRDIVITATANGIILGGVTYTIDLDIAFPINGPKPCSRCDKLNTEDHICVPKHLQCSLCGKPTVAIESCTCPEPKRCAVCKQIVSLAVCRICGMVYIVCGCPPTKHKCSKPQFCTNCGIQLGNIKHRCNCVCGELYTEDHQCDQLRKRCPDCGVVINTVACLKCRRKLLECGCLRPLHRCISLDPVLSCSICGGNHAASNCKVLPPILARCSQCGSNPCICKTLVKPPVVGPDLFVQKVVTEADIGTHLNEGWTVKLQLQSGSVILEKAIDIENIANEVLDQVNKQIADTVAKEKQRLLEK